MLQQSAHKPINEGELARRSDTVALCDRPPGSGFANEVKAASLKIWPRESRHVILDSVGIPISQGLCYYEAVEGPSPPNPRRVGQFHMDIFLLFVDENAVFRGSALLAVI